MSKKLEYYASHLPPSSQEIDFEFHLKMNCQITPQTVYSNLSLLSYGYIFRLTKLRKESEIQIVLPEINYAVPKISWQSRPIKK